MGEVSTGQFATPTDLGVDSALADRNTRRRLMLRDSLIFLSLTLITLVLFAVTLFLFRSFAAHREELGRRWSERGRAALDRGNGEQAVDSLRAALSYAPGERSYELLLARALALAGHTEEAYTYFTGLWDTEPGNGFINLELARLAAQKHEQTQAVNFYRAALYGTWEGDGVVRRRQIRVELARYLLQQHDVKAARAELLVAEGNAGDDPAFNLQIGDLFEQAGDPHAALDTYLKAAQATPKDPAPITAAARTAYNMGEYARAQPLLREALRLRAAAASDNQKSGSHNPFDLSDMLRNTDRILDLLPNPRLSSAQRAAKLLALRNIASQRLEACTAPPNALPPQMQDIRQRLEIASKRASRAALLRDQSRQDDLLDLVFEAERTAAATCGAPAGDDALLTLLAHGAKPVSR